eukprot:1827656-Pyramimonas_sp.AAC.1
MEPPKPWTRRPRGPDVERILALLQREVRKRESSPSVCGQTRMERRALHHKKGFPRKTCGTPSSPFSCTGDPLPCSLPPCYLHHCAPQTPIVTERPKRVQCE